MNLEERFEKIVNNASVVKALQDDYKALKEANTRINNDIDTLQKENTALRQGIAMANTRLSLLESELARIRQFMARRTEIR